MLARKRQMIFVTTVLTPDLGKSFFRIPLSRYRNYLTDIGAGKSRLPLKPFFVDLFEGRK